MDPTNPEVDLALRLADVGDHVIHNGTVFHVRRAHTHKKIERDRLGHERTTLQFSIDGIVGDPAFSEDEAIVGDLL